jgi:hypothetical protein
VIPPKIIGHIEAVDDHQIVVQLSKPAELGDSEDTCAHIGQIGSYVVIPQQDCDMLATVIAQRKINGPEQNRTVINVLAIGMIREGKFCRGIHRYPVVGEPVRSAGEENLAAIFAEMGSLDTDEQNKRPPRLALGKFTANPKYD